MKSSTIVFARKTNKTQIVQIFGGWGLRDIGSEIMEPASREIGYTTPTAEMNALGVFLSGDRGLVTKQAPCVTDNK